MSNHSHSVSTPSLRIKKLDPKPSMSPLFSAIEKLPKITNYSTTPSLNNSMLMKLKSRKKKEEVQVDPLIAANVVKKYLLPMFERSKVHETNATRKQIMGLSVNDLASRNSTAESTVYHELKLSERLLKQLEESNLKVAETEAKAAVFEQEKFMLVAEINELKLVNENLLINYEMYNLQINQNIRAFHSSDMKHYFAYKQLEHFRKLSKTYEAKINELSEEIHEEKNLNDIRLKQEIFPLTL